MVRILKGYYVINTDDAVRFRTDCLIAGDFQNALTGDIVFSDPVPFDQLRPLFTDTGWSIFVNKTFRRWQKWAKTQGFQNKPKNEQMFLANTLISTLREEP